LENELNAAKLHGINIKKGRDLYKLKTGWAAGNGEAFGEDVDGLKLEKEELRSQCKNCTVQEKQLKTVRREQWEWLENGHLKRN
jgi:hypothetical protein